MKRAFLSNCAQKAGPGSTLCGDPGNLCFASLRNLLNLTQVCE